MLLCASHWDLPCSFFFLFTSIAAYAASPVPFNTRSARSGQWSDPKTWTEERVPRAGDNVQIRAGHAVIYDANSDQALRVLHVAGTLTFARDRSTRLDVGLLKVQPGEECAEDGFNCHEMADPPAVVDSRMP
jgi:hypothetical protein